MVGQDPPYRLCIGRYMELQFIRMELEAATIPFFVVGQHFGSLYPGMQMLWYNERSVVVPASYVEQAQEAIQHIHTYLVQPKRIWIRFKLRIIFEALLLGWLISAGKKKTSGNESNQVITMR